MIPLEKISIDGIPGDKNQQVLDFLENLGISVSMNNRDERHATIRISPSPCPHETLFKNKLGELSEEHYFLSGECVRNSTGGASGVKMGFLGISSPLPDNYNLAVFTEYVVDDGAVMVDGSNKTRIAVWDDKTCLLL